MTAPHTVPSVSVSSITADRWNVVMTRGSFGPVSFEAGSRIHAEAVAAELRGALADAFHAGRAEALDDRPTNPGKES